MHEALVLRLDQGPSNTTGHYRCTVPRCDWQVEAASGATPYKHMMHVHGAEVRKVEYQTKKRKQTVEEKVVSHREADRRYRAKLKVGQTAMMLHRDVIPLWVRNSADVMHF